MKKITPFLWFDSEAEEAMNYYVSIFKNSKAGKISRYSEAGPGAPGSVMMVEFELDGQEFTAMNAGPHFKFTEAISFMVSCETQAEVDEYWEKLSEGGSKSHCGWVKDKYGLSWQITPTALMELQRSGDPEKKRRVMEAMMKMGKLDIEGLVNA